MQRNLLTFGFLATTALSLPIWSAQALAQNGSRANGVDGRAAQSVYPTQGISTDEGGSGEPDGTIVVTGRAQRLYRVDEVVTGKLPTEPLASSQTITTITDQLIQDQGARDAQDLYRNISGVSFFSYAGVTARGFRQEEIFYDGLRGDPYAGFSVPQLFNVERVEFLKGPSGMLYGPGAPGGLFNYVTKKPDDTFEAEVSGVVGTEGRSGGSGEINIPLGNGFAARGAVFYEDRGTFRFNAASRTFIADAGLSYDAGPVQIILQATRYDQELDANRLRGVPADDDGNFIADRRWNHNEPTDYLNLLSDVLQVRVAAQPLDNLTFDATLRYNNAAEEQQYHEPRGLFDSDGDGLIDASIREFRDQMREQDTLSFGTNAVWSSRLGDDIGNRVLAGFDYFSGDQYFQGRSLRGATVVTPGLPSPLSLFDPVYGQSDSRTYDELPFTITQTDSTRHGVYLLDELTIGPVILTGGLRYDSFRDESGDVLFKDNQLTYRLGAVYRVRDDISFFGQYATSFEPQTAASQNPLAGGPFAPTKGNILEGGMKTSLANGRVQSSLSAYRIVRTNILQTDPAGDAGNDGIDDLLSIGEITSQGIEFDLSADITPDWVLTFAYGYNDTRISGDNGGGGFSNNIGDRFANAPKHQIGFWTRYQIPEIGIAGALGGDYVSERISIDGQRVQPYFVFDASLIYESGPFRALARIDNIFDKTYAASGFIARTGHFPGRPRSAFVELKYSY